MCRAPINSKFEVTQVCSDGLTVKEYKSKEVTMLGVIYKTFQLMGVRSIAKKMAWPQKLDESDGGTTRGQC